MIPILENMNKYLSLISCVIVLIFAGCKGASKMGQQDNMVVEIDVMAQDGEASDFFDSWSFVPLETNSENLISRIKHMTMNDSLIVICSDDIFHIFDRSGKWVSSFNNLGQGPGEYLYPVDVKLHDGYIYVMCNSTRKIQKYSLDGRHQTTFDVKYPYIRFDFIGNDRILLTSGDGNSVSKHEYAVYDLHPGEIVSEFGHLDDPSAWILADFEPILFNDGSDILLGRLFDYTVYRYDETDSIPVPFVTYQFNTPVGLNEFDDMTMGEKCDKSTNKQVVNYLGPIFMDDNFITQQFSLFGSHGVLPYLYKYDRKNGNGKLLPIGLKYHDGFPYLASHPVLIQDGYYVSMLPPYSVRYIEEHAGVNDISSKVTLTDDDNPVLVFHHFRTDSKK